MNAWTRSVPAAYRQPFSLHLDAKMRKALGISSALGVVVLLIVWLAPERVVKPVTVEEISERMAKLILEEPKPPPPLPKAKVPEAEKTPEPAAPPKEVVESKPKPPPPVAKPTRRPEKPKVAEDKGKAGREKAKQVTQQLAQVTSSLDDAVADVTSALATSDDGKASPRPKRRKSRVRGGRGSRQLSGAAGEGTMAKAGNGGGSLEGTQIAIASITPVSGLGTLGGTSGGSGGSGSGIEGQGRTTDSLLGVVRRYAAGVQFCYDQVLKSDPSLRGKVSLRITVSPSGRVSNVKIVQNTVGSSSMDECILAQVREWRFPKASGTDVTFEAPFVFTPPKK